MVTNLLVIVYWLLSASLTFGADSNYQSDSFTLILLVGAFPERRRTLDWSKWTTPAIADKVATQNEWNERSGVIDTIEYGSIETLVLEKYAHDMDAISSLYLLWNKRVYESIHRETYDKPGLRILRAII